MDTKELIMKYGLGIPKRYNLKQKQFFLNEIGKEFQALGYKAKGVVGKKKSSKAVNLVVGDVKNAETLILAHYDTPSHNFGNPIKYHPFNGPATFSSSFIPTYTPLIIGMLILFWVVTQKAGEINFQENLVKSIIYTVLMVASFTLPPIMIVGVGNKVNFNYNTSGCVGALKLAEKLTPEQRKKVAFVLTDQGCKRFVGDYILREALPNIDEKLVIVLDCIGDGERFAIGYKEDSEAKAKELANCFKTKPIRVRCHKENMRYTGFSYYANALKISRVTKDGSSLIVNHTSSNNDIHCDDTYVNEVADALAKFC